MPDVPAPPNSNPECPCPAAMSKEKKDAVNWGRNNPVFQNPVAAQTSNAQGGFAAGLAKANQVSGALKSLGGNTSQIDALSSRIGNMQGVLSNFSNQSNRLSGLPFTGNGPDLLSLVSTVTAAVDFQCALGIEGLDVGAKIGLVTEDGKMKLNVAIDVQADLNKLLDKLPQGDSTEPGFLQKMQEGLAGIQEGINKITNKMDEVAGGLNNAMDQVSGMFDDALDFVTQFTNINFAINLSNDPCTKFGVGFKQGILNPAFIDQARNANPLKRALNPGFGSGTLPSAANLPVGTQDAAASVAPSGIPSIPETPSEYAAQYESPQQKASREEAATIEASNQAFEARATTEREQAHSEFLAQQESRPVSDKRQSLVWAYQRSLLRLRSDTDKMTRWLQDKDLFESDTSERRQAWRQRLAYNKITIPAMVAEAFTIFPLGYWNATDFMVAGDWWNSGPAGCPVVLNAYEKTEEGSGDHPCVPAGEKEAILPPNREAAAEPVATKETDAKNDGSMSAMDADLKKWDKAATADGKSMNEVQKQDLVGEPEKAKEALKEAGLTEQPATDTPKSKRLAEIAARIRIISRLQGDLERYSMDWRSDINEEENKQNGFAGGKYSDSAWMAPDGKYYILEGVVRKKYQEEKNALFLERSNLEK